MNYVLIILHKGFVKKVKFFHDGKSAIIALSEFVKIMNVEHNDASLYDIDGLVANAKHFLDEKDRYFDNTSLVGEVSNEKIKATYIIGNPSHHLGFMVASPDDPIGYNDPAEAISVLEQMRNDFGRHLKIYQVIPVQGPIATLLEVEKYCQENEINDFNPSLIKEYFLQN
jgi:hypothetical protein